MKGVLMNVLAGGLGVLAANVGGNFNAQFGPGAGMAAVGYLMNNSTLETMAGMSLGQNLAGGLTGGGSTGGGWY